MKKIKRYHIENSYSSGVIYQSGGLVCLNEDVKQLENQFRDATEKVKWLKDLLQSLYDEQNGVPLLRRESQYKEIIARVEKEIISNEHVNQRA